MSDLANEPLTEAVGDTQQAPQISYAWSEEMPTLIYPRRRWAVVGKCLVWGPLLAVSLAFGLGVAWAARGLIEARPAAPSAQVAPSAPSAAPVIPPPPQPPTPTPLPSTDDNFIAALINHDASITDTSVAIHNAHQVCGDLGRGVDRPDIAESIKNATDGYTETRAAVFVALSANFYCPQYGTTLD